MKQTGIKYLAEQLKYYDFEKSEQSYVFKISVAKFNELIEKAKLIDKENIIEAANTLLYRGTGPGDMWAEQYYTETYEK